MYKLRFMMRSTFDIPGALEASFRLAATTFSGLRQNDSNPQASHCVFVCDQSKLIRSFILVISNPHSVLLPTSTKLVACMELQ